MARTALAFARKEGLVNGEIKDFNLEIHAIEDPVRNRTFYFGMPSRDYLPKNT